MDRGMLAAIELCRGKDLKKFPRICSARKVLAPFLFYTLDDGLTRVFSILWSGLCRSVTFQSLFLLKAEFLAPRLCLWAPVSRLSSPRHEQVIPLSIATAWLFIELPSCGTVQLVSSLFFIRLSGNFHCMSSIFGDKRVLCWHKLLMMAILKRPT